MTTFATYVSKTFTDEADYIAKISALCPDISPLTFDPLCEVKPAELPEYILVRCCAEPLFSGDLDLFDIFFKNMFKTSARFFYRDLYALSNAYTKMKEGTEATETETGNEMRESSANSSSTANNLQMNAKTEATATTTAGTNETNNNTVTRSKNNFTGENVSFITEKLGNLVNRFIEQFTPLWANVYAIN